MFCSCQDFYRCHPRSKNVFFFQCPASLRMHFAPSLCSIHLSSCSSFAGSCIHVAISCCDGCVCFVSLSFDSDTNKMLQSVEHNHALLSFLEHHKTMNMAECKTAIKFSCISVFRYLKKMSKEEEALIRLEETDGNKGKQVGGGISNECERETNKASC